jgi:hypothetical protein
MLGQILLLAVSTEVVPVSIAINGFGQSRFETLAAKEACRYWGLLSGTSPSLILGEKLDTSTPQIIVASRTDTIHAALQRLDPAFGRLLAGLGKPDSHLVHQIDPKAATQPIVVCVGATPRATLYAVYSLLEILGARFYLHGDVLPEPNVLLRFPAGLSRTFTPRFEVRGLQPFHDFPMVSVSACSAPPSCLY